ncbi:MAG: hypothetical protein ABGZ53_11200, partial [Fuerstiella sp.]
ARVRQQLTPSEDVLSGELLTMEQVRRAANVVVSSMSFPPRTREELYRAEEDRQHDHTRRNAQASQSHRLVNRTGRQDENDWRNSVSIPKKSIPYRQNHRLHRIKPPNMALSS